LDLDPANTIADKNLRRLSQLSEAAVRAQGEAHRAEPQHFIEEMGKAGVVALRYLASPEMVVKMVAGDAVYLKVEEENMVVENSQGEYLGQLEPKHAHRLIRLIRGGNRYTAAVVRSGGDRLIVIIREVYQDPSQVGQLSFPPRGLEKLQPYVSERIVKSELEEEEGEPSEIYDYSDEG
jgi:hypothetical protein